MRWTDFGSDPNTADVVNWRAQGVRRARAQPISDRIEYIKQLAANKRVLDVGVVDHTIGHQHSADWLHGAIASVAASVVGVDVLPEAVQALQKEGYNVRLWDVTQKPLDEQFELIVVGEVIEHLGCPGLLFESARKMLVAGGRILLTTPNPYYIARVRDGLLRGLNLDSVDHVTLLFPFGIAELSERAGLRLDRWRGLTGATPRGMKGRIALSMLQLLPFSRETFCNTLIYECVPQ